MVSRSSCRNSLIFCSDVSYKQEVAGSSPALPTTSQLLSSFKIKLHMRTIIARTRWGAVLFLLFFVSIFVAPAECQATTPKTTRALVQLNTFSSQRDLPNGIEVQSGKAIIQVIALR